MNYQTVIRPRTGWFDINLKELHRYRDLIFLFVRRDFSASYKQTILGPLWALIQPLLTTVVFTLIFGNIAQLAPAGVPSFAFYFSANMMWSYFANCLTHTAETFTKNSHLLGKVYFPRLVMPISTVISQLISLGIQFAIFLAFWTYYLIVPSGLLPNTFIALTPLLVLQLMLLGFGVGVIVSACTTKYRDLAFAVSFCMQLWMYATPVVYDISIIPEKWIHLYMLNPVAPIIMTMRYAFLGLGAFEVKYYLIGWAATLMLVSLGVILFSRVEKTFMDTV